MEDIPMTDLSDGSFLIPETQMELDVRNFSSLNKSAVQLFSSFFQNLTEYNTAHNRRISMLGITDDNNLKKVNCFVRSKLSFLLVDQKFCKK